MWHSTLAFLSPWCGKLRLGDGCHHSRPHSWERWPQHSTPALLEAFELPGAHSPTGLGFTFKAAGFSKENRTRLNPFSNWTLLQPRRSATKPHPRAKPRGRHWGQVLCACVLGEARLWACFPICT